MRQICRLIEVSEVLEHTDLSKVPDDMIALEDGRQLMLSGWYVFLPKFDLKLHEGLVGSWNKEFKSCMPEEEVTVVLKQETEKIKEICYMRAGMIEMIEEWFHGSLQMEEVEQLRCELVIPK